MLDRSKWVDSFGLPGTLQPDGSIDGGDTCAIVCNLLALGDKSWAPRLPQLWSHDHCVPLRHPDPTKWYSRPDRFSRDQLITVLCAGIAGFPFLADLSMQAHARKWYLTAWNTRKNGTINTPEKAPDITGPEIWALELRLKKPWWRRAVLWLFDIESLIGTLHWRWFRKDRVTRNHMLVAIITRDHDSTWVSRLSYRLNRWDDLLSRWRDHCAAVGECPTADLFQAKISQNRIENERT